MVEKRSTEYMFSVSLMFSGDFAPAPRNFSRLRDSTQSGFDWGENAIHDADINYTTFFAKSQMFFEL